MTTPATATLTADRFAVLPVYNAQYRRYVDRLHVRKEDAEDRALCGADLMGARPAEAADARGAVECQRCATATRKAEREGAFMAAMAEYDLTDLMGQWLGRA